MTPARPAHKRLNPLFRTEATRFVTDVLVLAAGDECPYRPTGWADTLVEVEAGQLELVSSTGTLLRLAAGSVLTLDGLPLRALRGAGAGPTVLVTTTRSRR